MTRKINQHTSLNFLFILITLLVIGGCSGDSTTKPSTSVPTPIYLDEEFRIGDISSDVIDTIIACDSKVAIMIGEGYTRFGTNTEPWLYVRQKTDKIYKGLAFPILNRVETSQGKIHFTNEGVMIPKSYFCALDQAYASSYFNAPVGTYELTFVNGDLSDVYLVNVSDTSITIDQHSENFTYPTHELFWRYPVNSFVLTCYTPEETSYLCEEIVDSLKKHIDLEEFFFPDSGVVPFIPDNYGQYRFFLYQEDSDFVEVVNIFGRFAFAQHEEGNYMRVIILNWLGESYESWEFYK
jgi:hypothetical protein